MRRLRLGEPSVLARVVRDQAVFDPRAVPPAQDPALVHAIIQAWRATLGMTSASAPPPLNTAGG
jgi:hypothetical protein